MFQKEEARKFEERMIRKLEEIHKNHEEDETTIVGLKGQIVKAKIIEEDLTSQLQEKKEFCKGKILRSFH